MPDLSKEGEVMTEPLNEKALPVASDAEVASVSDDEVTQYVKLRRAISATGYDYPSELLESLLRRAREAEAERDAANSSIYSVIGAHMLRDRAEKAEAELTAARAEIDRIGKYLFRAQVALHMCNSVFVPGNDDANGRIADFLAELDENFSSDKAEEWASEALRATKKDAE
jgi:hypothetical protein